MPLYHYKCTNCNAELEIQQRISESALHHCPNCETEGLKRVIGLGGGFVLKGSGFYNTDYKNAPVSSEGNSKVNESSKTDSKSDSVPQPTKAPETKQNTESKQTAHICSAGCAH